MCDIAAPATAAATGGVPSTPGMAGKASGMVSGVAGADAGAKGTSSSDAVEGEAMACSSRRASRMGTATIWSIVLASSSGMASIEGVVERSLTTSPRERLALLEDTEESKERAWVWGTHSLGSLFGVSADVLWTAGHRCDPRS